MFKMKLYNWLIPKLLSKNCPDKIPRSGADGKQINCFSIRWDEPDRKPFFLVRDFSNKKFYGMKWNGSRYEGEHEISITDAEENYHLRVTHYYGLTDIRFQSIIDIAFNYITKWVYLKIQVLRLIERFSSYLFNKRHLVTKKRIELLRFLVDSYLDKDKKEFNAFFLMGDLYSIRWIDHPQGKREKKKLELFLFAFREEGILKQNNNGNYELQGKALTYLEKNEEEERRHKDSLKLRRRVFWLTVLVAFAALVTADIIKVPTLLDFRPENVDSRN